MVKPFYVLNQVGQIQQYHLNGLKRNLLSQMHKIAESVSLLFNVDCEVKFEEGYPPTMNSPKVRV